MEKKGKVSKGDGMDVHHVDFNTANNSPKNLKVLPKKVNRQIMPPSQK